MYICIRLITKTNKMNLLKRLKPHYTQLLLSKNVEYPYLIESITDALEENKYVINLTYGTVIDLQMIFGHCSPHNFFEENE